MNANKKNNNIITSKKKNKTGEQKMRKLENFKDEHKKSIQSNICVEKKWMIIRFVNETLKGGRYILLVGISWIKCVLSKNEDKDKCHTYMVLKTASFEKAPGWMDSNSIKSVNILERNEMWYVAAICSCLFFFAFCFWFFFYLRICYIMLVCGINK